MHGLIYSETFHHYVSDFPIHYCPYPMFGSCHHNHCYFYIPMILNLGTLAALLTTMTTKVAAVASEHCVAPKTAAFSGCRTHARSLHVCVHVMLLLPDRATTYYPK
jgi:hypothetical protein